MTESFHIFKGDKKTIDTQKVVFSIWKNRGSAAFVKDFTETLSKFVEEKRVFNEIEFYLPQLAHLIIHLEIDWPAQSLERLAIVLSQTSMHTALQLSFMFIAALEDYQPENADGKVNSSANLNNYLRCSRLLQNVERSVVFGLPSLSADYIQPSRPKSVQIEANAILDSTYLEKMNRADEILQATRVLPTRPVSGAVNSDVITTMGANEPIGGILLYKRVVRKSKLSSKAWKSRYFTIEQQILFCYRDKKSDIPLRSMLIRDFELTVVHREKYEFQFELLSKTTGVKFQLRAESETNFDYWVLGIKRELNQALLYRGPDLDDPARPPSPFLSPALSSDNVSVKFSMKTANMSAGERRRHEFFQQQRDFIGQLTTICEELRFLERPLRSHFLKRDVGELVVPPFCYLPLCRSVDTWRYVLRTLPMESHAFNTKARCPALMMFEVEEYTVGDKNDGSAVAGSDVATFLGLELTNYNDDTIPLSTATLPMLGTRKSSWWRPEGTGILRIGASEGKAAAIPVQSIANNTALREIRKSSMEGAADMPDLKRLSIMKRTDPGTQDPTAVPSTPESAAATAADKSETDFPVVNFMTSGETFKEKMKRLRTASPYGHLPGWRVDGLIAKSNDDLRQEAFVMQLITYYQIALLAAKVPVWLYTYRILSTSKTTGLIQLIPDAVSLDGLKKRDDYPGSLRKHFEKSYGLDAAGNESPALAVAIGEYVQSLAAYSIVCYALAIKDRHNGNIMIDSAGRFIHIDFGFVFGLAPGKQFSMETAPWKLTDEMVEVMGGRKSSYFKEYRNLCTQTFIEIRRHSEAIIILMEIMTHKSSFPAFRYNPNAIKDFQKRLMLKVPDSELQAAVNRLIDKSQFNNGTGLYDSFQTATNGIAK